MKRFILLSLFFLAVAAGLASQEQEFASNEFAVGIGLEYNNNSRKGHAGGLALNFDYNLPVSLPFAVGIDLTGSSSFQDSFVFEASVCFRWYFLGAADGGGTSKILGRGRQGFFAQANLGYFLMLETGYDNVPLFLGELRAGYRFPLGMFYAEPYGRFGWPFVYGIGVAGGVLLGGNNK